MKRNYDFLIDMIPESSKNKLRKYLRALKKNKLELMVN